VRSIDRLQADRQPPARLKIPVGKQRFADLKAALQELTEFS
jgi:hypothetical protein